MPDDGVFLPTSDPRSVANADAGSASIPALIIRTFCGPDLPPDDVHRRLLSWTGAAAPNTLRAIASDLKIIDAYQSSLGKAALPMSSLDVYGLIIEQARLGKSKSSIDRLVASISRLHQLVGAPSPVDDNIRWKLREIRKADTRIKKQARGLRLKGDVADIREDAPSPVSLLGLLESIPANAIGLRDRALISTGYDAGLRRSELVRIQVAHIEKLPTGEASLFIPRSKTDQEGEGARAWLSARSVQHLTAWLDLAQLTTGYVFRPMSYRVGAAGHLAEGAVSKILKQRLSAYLTPLVESGTISANEMASIIEDTSAHSLRVGCDQDLFAAGVDLGAIMQGLRWTNPKQPLAYARHLAPATSKLAAAMRNLG